MMRVSEAVQHLTMSIAEKSMSNRGRVPSLALRATESNHRNTGNFNNMRKPLLDNNKETKELGVSNMSLGNTEYSYSIAKGTSIMNNLQEKQATNRKTRTG